VEAGLDAAIVHASKILPLSKIDERAREVCLDLIYDRRHDGYDPLTDLLALFEGVSASAGAVAEDRSGWTVERRLEHRIIDGDRNGIEGDLEEAMAAGHTPLIIINDFLLAGMKTVGELFASGEMQLPFVLGSAETMKTAVAYLEPFMEKADQGGKGTMVLATVKGDVHDIGKNLVDIILTNNGYTVKNLGIKVGIAEMVSALEESGADAIGMSGLLVKSTLIMRDNLEELNRRGLSHIPVILGGAALTRTYVERDLRKVYDGRLFYGKDAFEGLRTMDRLVELTKSGEDDPEFGTAIGGRDLGPRKSEQRRQAAAEAAARGETLPARSPEVATDNPTFKPPFLGSRVAKGMPIDEVAAYLNETALFRNQWGFRPEKGEDDPGFKDRVRGLLREQLATATAQQLLVPQVAWGHFAANADGDDLVIFEDESRTRELTRYAFPRQTEDPWLCISDFFRAVESGEPDWASFMVVTMGSRVSEEAARLFEANEYQQYLYLHGLGVEMAEALAEYWHRRIREELGFADQDGPTLTGLFRQKYRGGRYSWGYPACPELEDNAKVVELLGADRIGVEVSEGFQLHPEQSTTAIICHHPQAKYFVA
jgi:5-methyltetrahydrofolate--homocysteine methyltransferase